MHKATKAKLAALAAAILLSGGLYGKQAEAMPLAFGVRKIRTRSRCSKLLLCAVMPAA